MSKLKWWGEVVFPNSFQLYKDLEVRAAPLWLPGTGGLQGPHSGFHLTFLYFPFVLVSLFSIAMP